MEPLTAAEIRERFLAFFEARGHRRMSSDSLVPANDPTLLFTGAGMNQFKDMFLGKGSLPDKRVTTSQKCLRVPDLENVGVTPRHHTFFEMLGNFSFGDYFKAECIAWEWEFFSQELGIPEEQMVVTIYKDDDEAAAIWQERIGLSPDKIFRFGEKENFWPAEAPSKGPNGPCGPCSEIYFDARPGEPYPDKKGLHDLPDDRFTEIGNCVFTQYERRDGGELVPLPQKNIDVGLGLERIVAVLQDAPNNFETDLFRPYIAFLEEKAGKKYGDDRRDDQRMRRIADHARAVTHCIADGALPGNEGRGYVVRKILRRAARDGIDLGIQESFLHAMVDVVGEVMGDAYPEVRENAAQCRALMKSEEEGFAAVYRRGMVRLQEFLERSHGSRGTADGAAIAGTGAFAFELHDTYGFPSDITRQVFADRGIPFDEGEFERCMTEQRERAREHAKTSDAVFAENAAMALRARGVRGTEFVGYTEREVATEVAALLDDGDRPVETLEAGATGKLVVPTTPFYAQGGGQVGDRGTVSGDGVRALVHDTVRLDSYHLHPVRVQSGALRVGQAVTLAVDTEARDATERNHTATHLLHAALKDVLGEHVSQAGSEVSPERLRFDYTHGEKLTPEQIAAIEDLVSREIMAARDVDAVVLPMDEARAAGFVALFGEKYGSEVRTLAVGEFSKELCGGTHVDNSGNIGGFRIISESAISAGTRRIEAVTGHAAAAVAREERRTLEDLASSLKVPVADVGSRVQDLVKETKRLRKELEKATAAHVGAVAEEMAKAVEARNGANIAVFRTQGLAMKELQDLLGRARKAHEPLAAVVFVPAADGVLVGAVVDKALQGTVRAGDLVKELCGMLGGGGGGRPDMAQGKGRDAGKVAAAEARAAELLAGVGTG